jgi:predicted enzyme related to lactoylglutathione lyase
MADPTVRGRFVWHELLTSDPEAAQKFYPQISGWKIQRWDKDSNYSMFVGPNGPIGGALKLPEQAMGTGEQPKWLPYIATEDVDATVQKATSLGARVLQKSDATPGGGRYAVLADPQGACFGIYGSTTAEPPEAHHDVARGEFSWHELSTSDHAAAFQFYSELFGWDQLVEHDMGQMGTYRIFGIESTQLGGMFNKTTDMPGEPAWVSYVLVPNAAKSVDKIRAGGGQILNGPMEVPGGDWVAVALDPQGAPFAVHAIKAKAKSRAAAAVSAPAEPVPEREEVATPQAPQRKAKKTAEKVTPAAPAESPAPSKKSAAKKTVSAKTKAPAKKKSATKKRAASKKAAGKKTAPRKTASRKTGAKKAGRKAVSKKASKKTIAKRKTTQKKAAKRKAGGARRGKKAAVKKSARRKSAARKSAARKSSGASNTIASLVRSVFGSSSGKTGGKAKRAGKARRAK